ncbi:hypothetical protein SS50377_22396 [Spironucleus salmonicida]|uniref:Uncharacterized protein n=1 Tax=Spironucleus salmonicida TaxID=348837 RepID=V6LC78_9EUKA|nr:hypothetical protein SS50377_22396 [Spironucleus salmonicida]|eukprot:EST42110.1 Hypothetical protein SS50377_18419 [Spironucleus salmonicida]
MSQKNIILQSHLRSPTRLLQIRNQATRQSISPLYHMSPPIRYEKPKTVNYPIRTTSPDKLDLMYDCMSKVQKQVPGATAPKKLRYIPKPKKPEITFEHRLAYIKSLGSTKKVPKTEELAANYFKIMEIEKVVLEKQQEVTQIFNELIKQWQDLNNKDWPQKQDLHQFQ